MLWLTFSKLWWGFGRSGPQCVCLQEVCSALYWMLKSREAPKVCILIKQASFIGMLRLLILPQCSHATCSMPFHCYTLLPVHGVSMCDKGPRADISPNPRLQHSVSGYGDANCLQGADTVIYERMAPNHPVNQQTKEVTRQHMEEFGSAGLRTLCLAYAEIGTDFYDR